MKHVGQVGRPVGGSGALPGGGGRRVRGGGRRRCAPDARGQRHPLRGRAACGASRSPTAPSSTAPVVVAACDPRTALVEWLRDAPGRRRRRCAARWTAAPVADGYESKLDAVVAAPPHLPPDRPAGRAAARLRPADGHDDRGAAGRRHRRRPPPDGARAAWPSSPMFYANVPSALDPTMRVGRRPRVQPRGALHAVRARGRLAGVEGARALARALRDARAARVPRRRAPVAGHDARPLRVRVLPAPRPRHELRRRPAGRPARPPAGAHPLRDAGAGPLPHRRGHVPGRRRVGRVGPQRRRRRPPPRATDVPRFGHDRASKRVSTAVRRRGRGGRTWRW